MAEERKHAACTGCREKKLRCVPSPEGGDSCHRCAKLGKQCQVPEVKQRKRKTRLRGRVDQLESSYSEILALLKQHPRPETYGSTTGSTRPPRSTADTPDSQSTELAGFPSNATDSITIQQMPHAECESLINDYRRMSHNNFPYVIIPENCPAASLIEERPMLAQAIFIATSWRNPAHQSALKAVFLSHLADRYFNKSERSLDLLQALIVFFGWCHWYTAPMACQAYRLGSLVVSLAVELGINQRPMNITQHEMIVSSNSGFSQTNEAISPKFWSYEARRAFVGAYVISTFCLLLFRRPSTLAYSPYLEECASSLSADPQYPPDSTLIYMIRSLHIAEQTTHTFDHGSKEKVCELSDEKIQILVKTLSMQIEDWRASLPSGVFDIGCLQRQYRTGRAYIYEVGIYGLLQGQTPSVTRVSIIYECFTSSMKFLSDILELSLEAMADWTSLDWRMLNFAIMLSTKSSIILDSYYGSTGAGVSQRAAWLGKCLDMLCLRTEELYHLTGVKTDKDHYFKKLSADWANMKIYHQNCIQRSLAQASSAATALQAAASTTSTTHLLTPQPQSGQTQQDVVVPYMDNRFDMDPFNELFWAGFADLEMAPPNNIF